MKSPVQSFFRSVLQPLFRRFSSSRAALPSSAQPQQRLKHPGLSAAFGVLALLYTLWPMDLIPDFIPFLGWLDDGIALFFAFRQARQLVAERAVARTR